MSDVLDAIEVAAGAEVETGPGIPSRVTPSRRQIARAKALISRFVDNLPEDMTVFEIREQMEGRDDD